MSDTIIKWRLATNGATLPRLSPSEIAEQVQRGLDWWAKHLRFRFVRDAGDAPLVFTLQFDSFFASKGIGGALGTMIGGFPGPTLLAINVWRAWFDSENNRGFLHKKQCQDTVAFVAAHEFGHSLGLGHSHERSSVMNDDGNIQIEGLSAGDVANAALTIWKRATPLPDAPPPIVEPTPPAPRVRIQSGVRAMGVDGRTKPVILAIGEDGLEAGNIVYGDFTIPTIAGQRRYVVAEAPAMSTIPRAWSSPTDPRPTLPQPFKVISGDWSISNNAATPKPGAFGVVLLENFYRWNCEASAVFVRPATHGRHAQIVARMTARDRWAVGSIAFLPNDSASLAIWTMDGPGTAKRLAVSEAFDAPRDDPKCEMSFTLQGDILMVIAYGKILTARSNIAGRSGAVGVRGTCPFSILRVEL